MTDLDRQHRDVLDAERLHRACGTPVNLAVLDAGPVFAAMSGAERASFIIDATIGYLLGHGLIQVVDWPDDRGFTRDIPDHLKPRLPADLAGRADT